MIAVSPVLTPMFLIRSAVQVAQVCVDNPKSRRWVSDHIPSGQRRISTATDSPRTPSSTRSHHGPLRWPSSRAPSGVLTSTPAKIKVSPSDR